MPRHQLRGFSLSMRRVDVPIILKSKSKTMVVYVLTSRSSRAWSTLEMFLKIVVLPLGCTHNMTAFFVGCL